MSRRRKLPAEPFPLVISELDHNGRGMAEHDGRSLRVFGALPGEEVTALHRFGRQFKDQAQVLDVLVPAPGRVLPKCPNFGTCGACTLQHLDYDAQLEFKQQSMLKLLWDYAAVRPGRLLAPLSAGPWSYRRKARLSVRHVPGKGRVLVGFREQDGRFVMDMRECHTLDQRVAEELEGLSNLLDGMEARQTIPQIEACCGDEDCALVVRHLESLSQGDIQRLQAYAAETGFHIWLQPKGPDTLHALETGKESLQYALPDEGVRFTFGPLDFVQVNAGLNRLMVTQALDLLEIDTDHRVLDLFCGLGNFTLPLARHAAEVVGVEGSAALVERAAENAGRNDLGNATFMQSDLYSETVGQGWPAGKFDRVLLDPPRSGAAAVLGLLAHIGAPRILYVSCSAESLAADTAQLVSEHGYQLSAAGIMDMFPQTVHIETMALFEKKQNPGGPA